MTKLPFCDPIFKTIPCVVTVGVFDGLHRGHEKVIRECVLTALALKAFSVVLTFNINPKMRTGREEFFPRLTEQDEFDNILNNLGVNYLCVIDFSDDISKLSGEEFIAGLCTSYDVRAMVVGKDFRCGNSADSAGCSLISEFLSEYTSSAFLKVVPSVTCDGEEVSSSLIRRCLLTGDLAKAERLLGRPLSPGLRVKSAVEKFHS